MDFLIVFLLVFFPIHFIRLHYKAAKRLKALEESIAEMAVANTNIAEAVGRINKIVTDHDLELMSMRFKLKRK